MILNYALRLICPKWWQNYNVSFCLNAWMSLTRKEAWEGVILEPWHQMYSQKMRQFWSVIALSQRQVRLMWLTFSLHCNTGRQELQDVASYSVSCIRNVEYCIHLLAISSDEETSVVAYAESKTYIYRRYASQSFAPRSIMCPYLITLTELRLKSNDQMSRTDG